MTNHVQLGEGLNLVKWIDPETGGWRTGVTCIDPDGCLERWAPRAETEAA